MYPLHKYLPTPFGTYLLYIDNGPTRVQVNKDRPQLPSYQTLKEYGRTRQQQHQQPTSKYEAYSKPANAVKRTPSKPVTAPPVQKNTGGFRKKDALTPSSTMPHSIWSPKVKRMHLSYNMRQLWHTGQPMTDPPSKIVEVDAVTGAELKKDSHWYKGRSSTEHEGINASPSSLAKSVEMESKSPVRNASVEKPHAASAPIGKSRRPKVPPNTATNSPVLSEAYKRQASQLRNDMVPKRQKRSSRSRRSQLSGDQPFISQVNRETQTTPYRLASSCMDYSEISPSPSIRGYSNQRSTSVPIGTPSSSRTKDCMEMTGLPPILETEIPVRHEPKPLPRAAITVESDGWGQRGRRAQEFRSTSPTFPIPSKSQYWEEMNKRRIASLPASHHNLLPFTWKEPKGFRSDDERQLQQRKLEVGKILPVITRMPAVPRI